MEPMDKSPVAALLEGLQRIEEKIDALTEKLGEFADQMEETVIRIEDATREPGESF